MDRRCELDRRDLERIESSLRLFGLSAISRHMHLLGNGDILTCSLLTYAASVDTLKQMYELYEPCTLMFFYRYVEYALLGLVRSFCHSL